MLRYLVTNPVKPLGSSQKGVSSAAVHECAAERVAPERQMHGTMRVSERQWRVSVQKILISRITSLFDELRRLKSFKKRPAH